MIQVNAETNWKIWTGVGLFGFFLVYLATFSAGRLVQKVTGSDPVSYSYEMPKLEPAEAPFDLSGRRVQRKVIGSLISEVDRAGVSPVATSVPAVKGAAVNGKNVKLTPAQVKAAALKKSTEAAAKAKALQVAKSKALQEQRKKRFEMLVLEQQRKKSLLSAEAISAGESTYTVATAGFESPAPESANEEEKKEDEDLNLSIAQWRALLQVSPTAANVNRLVRALDKKKIDSASFYQIAKELLRDSAADRHKAGFLMLSSVATVGTYEFMVTQMNDMSPEVQAALKKEIAKYSQPSLLSVTSRVISTSKETAVISSALGNLATALENYKKQPASGTISSQGGAKNPAITAGALAQFLNGLSTVGQNEDPALAAQAKNLSQSIQDLKK